MKLETRSGVSVVVYDDGSCRPAGDVEVEFFAQRDVLLDALEEMLRRSYNEWELRRIAREAISKVKGVSHD